ncbi:MAG: ACP S-malonyltransferase [Abditibacteriota bacterium]|nr:ACP S-malonyltransferase [Abditibacteriota bacterium]
MGILGKQIAFVFPGQGSQAVGMGKDFADNSPAARAVFDVAGERISGLCFEGPAEELGRTVNTQPALYTTCCAACAAVCELVRPMVCAGHSAGEYAALCAAGAFSFADGLALIQKRAELMDRCAAANPGGMAAVIGLAPEVLAEINARVKGVCVNANINSPAQTVVSGEKAALEEAAALYKEAGARRVVPLNVSGAFHSPLMEQAKEGLEKALQLTRIERCTVPVVANADALPETDPETVRANLARQLTGSVRWVESVNRMTAMGAEAFVELGSGTVLAGLVKKIAPGIPVVSVSCMADLDLLR